MWGAWSPPLSGLQEATIPWSYYWPLSFPHHPEGIGHSCEAWAGGRRKACAWGPGARVQSSRWCGLACYRGVRAMWCNRKAWPLAQTLLGYPRAGQSWEAANPWVSSFVKWYLHCRSVVGDSGRQHTQSVNEWLEFHLNPIVGFLFGPHSEGRMQRQREESWDRGQVLCVASEQMEL